MNWYKKVKISSYNNFAMPIRHDVKRYNDGKVDITFLMNRPGGTFRLITKNPVPDGYLTGDTSSLFIRLKEQQMLTTPAARRRRDEQESAKSKEIEPVKEEIKVVEKPKPKQLEFNFSNKRSRMIKKKSKIEKTKNENETGKTLNDKEKDSDV